MVSLLTLSVVLSLVSLAIAIKCYQCDSLSTPKCGHKFEHDESFLEDCSNIVLPKFLQSFVPLRNATGCIKKTFDSGSGHRQIARSCYFGNVENIQFGCQSDPSFTLPEQFGCDVCTTDGCNGST